MKDMPPSPLPNPSPEVGEGLQDSSPTSGEEGARREAVGRRGGEYDLLPFGKGMRSKPTDAEAKLWLIVRAKRLGGYKFKRQEQIGDYIADFVCFSARLIVEADGSQHADGADAVRDAWLAAQGFRIMRLWNNEILTNPDGVAQVVLAALETPLPNPHPQGEREFTEH